MFLRFTFLPFLTLLLIGATSVAQAQTTSPRFGFEFGSVAKIVQGTDTLAQAWAGGMNTPQFNAIDLNGDGRQDLYVFDRETSRGYTFLNVAGTNGRRWQYAPTYESAFPADLSSWVALRDYDCDGRPDLFTNTNGGNIRVFHNVAGSNGRPQFVLASDQLNFAFNGGTINLNTGYYNMPDIRDVNGDGRLDIITFEFVASRVMELYLNTGTGSCTNLNSFAQASNYWGGLISCADCASYMLNGSNQCQTTVVAAPTASATSSTKSANKELHSTGHNLLLLDLNGDGVLDLIDGRDNCPQLSRLLNAGTNAVPAFSYANITSSFPAGAPLTTSVFPAAYSIDTDFDGVPDLVVAPNQIDNSADLATMRHTVQQFRNTSGSASAVPSYTKVSDGFLQNDMLDVSEGAAPTFGDLDGDGLVDMLVGNLADQVNGYYRASLAYYRNVGTAHRPVFRLVTDDYLGLAAKAALTPTVRFENLRPTLVDLNRDGALDLVYSAFTSTGNRLNFLLNRASTGQAASFDPTQVDYFRPQGSGGTGVIAARQGDTPCFFDVDGDGYVDLLLGTNDNAEPGYSLRYFHNRGAGVAINSLFTLADNDYGMLRSDGSRPLYLSPTVADFDGDGHPDLLTVDGGGTARLYTDFRNQGTQFTERTDLTFNSLTNQYEAPHLGLGSLLHFAATSADLNQDGTLELYVGTETGGILSYLAGTHTVLASRPDTTKALALSIYPNPASSIEASIVETAQPTTLRLFDLTGRLVRHEDTALRSRTLDVQGLAPGLYVVQATATDGTTATQRLAVK